MRHSVLTTCAVLLAAVVFAGDPPKLGPEWTYDKEMREYTKTMPMKVTRFSPGVSGQSYHLDLRHDKFVVGDTDKNTSTSVWINGTMNLEIRKDPKGGQGHISFGVVNRYSYQDLDGDGVWDGWSDSRGAYTKRYIWRDGAWVPVCDSKGGFADGPALSLDRKTEYTWDGKAWTSRAVDR